MRLASVDRGGHHAIFTNIILPQLRLSGLQQVKAFARDLQGNVLNLQSQVKRVKKLTIRRARERATLEFMRASSLFSGAEELAQFEKATLEPLKVILFHCSNLQHLSLDMPARVLASSSRQQPSPGNGEQPSQLGQSLTELVTLLSVYGGDLNEALWSPGPPPVSRWSNLTHLQLHGPRFRMTSLTALAISQLPSLTHLALIMPLLVQPQTSLTGSDELAYHINSARDALGRCNVLQILINALGNRLDTLLLLCHDIENYVGNVQRLASWIRTLQWRCNTTIEERKPTKDPTRLILVTARPYNPIQTNPHPSLYSKWMLQRAERGVHWDWKQKEDGVTLDDMCEEMKLSYSVESWNMPIIYEAPLVRNLDDDDRINTREQQVDNDVARRWMGIDPTTEGEAEQDDSGFQSYASDEPNGIDNLD